MGDAGDVEGSRVREDGHDCGERKYEGEISKAEKRFMRGEMGLVFGYDRVSCPFGQIKFLKSLLKS